MAKRGKRSSHKNHGIGGVSYKSNAGYGGSVGTNMGRMGGRKGKRK